MSHETTIKITGIKARSERSWGRIRFQVCDPARGGWVTPVFPRDDEDCVSWLPVSDVVFVVASGVYLHGASPDERIAKARLRLADPHACGCDPGAFVIDDVAEIWLVDPADARSLRP